MGKSILDFRFWILDSLRRRSVLHVLAAAMLLSSPASLVSAGGAQSPAPIQNPKSKIQNALPSRIDPKAQAILDKTLQALGGPAFLGFKTLSTSGRAFSISDGTTVGFVTFDSSMEYPDKRRLAYGLGKKKPIILINNGDEAWEVDPVGLTTQRAEQVRTWKISNPYSLENLLRLRLREPGVLVQLGGVDFVDLTAVQIVEIFDAHHVQVKLAISKKTWLPVRISYRVQNPKTQDWDEYADDYSDYQTIQGIATPMHIARFVNDERVAETFRSKAKYDDTYPPGYFEPPSS
ncbi:MAG TPA: hypothetical protein VGW33_08230 [Terriglobia bacterium]|nr:hypothetical protein [Terriglobia bacterium]